MTSQEDRIRQQHERIENERRYKSRQFSRDVPQITVNIPNTVSDEIKLRKQLERLENEKQFYKKNSHLTDDRRLSLPAGTRVTSTSAHDRSDLPSVKSRTEQSTSVKSRLFDYEKTAPRSRRQLAMAPDNPPVQASTSRISPSKDALLSSLTPDPVPGGRKSTQSLNNQSDAVSLASTALEREASRRSSREPTVSFDERESISQQTRTSRANSLPGTSQHVDGKYPDEDSVKLQKLYDRAIATVKKADESIMMGEDKHTSSKERRSSLPRSNTEVRNKSSLDMAALKELETILHDARQYSSRRSSKEDHHRLDLGSNRAQKKRIQHLEQVLRQLNPNYGSNKEEYDPMKVLQCSYLRLSKSNIETLESMVRQGGRDPGIHIHSDVTDYDIWEGLKDERTDLTGHERRNSLEHHTDSKKQANGTAKKSTKV